MIAKLTDPWFEAKFIHDVKPDLSFRIDAEFAGAQGLWMYCPCGFEKKDERAHGLIIPFDVPGIPPKFGPHDKEGNHPRWKRTGTGLSSLTLSPSVLVNIENPCWHGHITGGIVT